MKDDQIVRVACALLGTVAYSVRLVVHGNGPVGAFGHEVNSFVAILGLLLLLAIPETMDRLPFGPSRSQE